MELEAISKRTYERFPKPACIRLAFLKIDIGGSPRDISRVKIRRFGRYGESRFRHPPDPSIAPDRRTSKYSYLNRPIQYDKVSSRLRFSACGSTYKCELCELPPTILQTIFSSLTKPWGSLARRKKRGARIATRRLEEVSNNAIRGKRSQ